MIKKVIITAFAIAQLSIANRRLLQQIPLTNPTTLPAPEPETPPALIPDPALPLPEPVLPSASLPTEPPIASLPAVPIDAAPVDPWIPIDPSPVPPQQATTVHPEGEAIIPVLSTHAPIASIQPVIETTSSSTTTRLPIIIPPSTTAAAPIISTIQSTAVPTAPNGFQFGAFGQFCPLPTAITGNTRQHRCLLLTDTITDADTGRIMCSQPSDCCMCASIQCGYGAVPCRQLRVGTSAAFGVKNIAIAGAEVGTGSVIDCQGIDSCREAAIFGRNIVEIDCGADGSCQDAVITVQNPKPNFGVDCTGASSCAGLKLFINLDAAVGVACPAVKSTLMMTGIECNGESACEGMEITVNNAGCNRVVIDNVECAQHKSCNGAVFNLIGDVDIANCQCGPSCQNAIGLEKCFDNLEYLLCADPLSCMGITKTIRNPANEFELICSNVQSCQNANFLIQAVPNAMSNAAPVTQWKGFTLVGMNAARGATFTIDNQLLSALDVDVIDCRGVESCLGAQFIIGSNVIIEDVLCAPGACYGCVVKRSATEPGIPCDSSQIASPELVQPIQPLPVNPRPIVEVPQMPQVPSQVAPQTPPQTIPGPWVPI